MKEQPEHVWLCGAGRARIRAKQIRCMFWGWDAMVPDQSQLCGPQGLRPQLILLWAVSVQDSFRHKFQLVIKAYHLSVVLA
jgi:hypothetical protein